MEVAMRRNPNTAAPGDGSRTMTITNDPTKEEGEHDESSNPQDGQIHGTLRLRAERNKPRVAWNEDVVDNEGCGKKSSKICCIYHKPRRFDESSDESDSDSESDDSSCGGSNHDRSRRHSGHNHQPHAGPSTHGRHIRSDSGSGVVHELEKPVDRDANAYERQPKGKRKA